MRVDAALARRDRKGGWACTESVPQDARRIETPILRARTRLEPCLSASRRRVFENSRADKGRSYPDRVQRRDETKLESRRGSDNQRRRRRLLERAGTDQRHRAFMLRALGIRVDQLVPMRRDTQRQRQQERGAYPTRDGTPDERGRQMARKLPLHWCADSPECVLKARVFSPPRVNCTHHRLKNTIEISANGPIAMARSKIPNGSMISQFGSAKLTLKAKGISHWN
jgi:hypothetical protein